MNTPIRRPVARPASAPSAGPRTRSSAFFTGDDGRGRIDEELAEQKRKAEERKAAQNAPYRFFNTPGEQRDFIILDEKPDFFMYEHALRDAQGNWGRVFCGCVKQTENCPVCAAVGKESYYGMYLSIIDLTPYVDKAGMEVPWSRKLLVVKPAQQKKFMRMYEQNGTLRGAVVRSHRDGDKDASIGNDFELLEFAPEEELVQYVRSWVDRERKQHTEDCSQPYDYFSLFEEPTAERLRAIVGGAPTPGSRAANNAALGAAPARPRPAPAPLPPEESELGGEGYSPPGDSRTYAARRVPAAPSSRAPAPMDDGGDDVPFEGSTPVAGPPSRMPVRRPPPAAARVGAAPAPAPAPAPRTARRLPQR